MKNNSFLIQMNFKDPIDSLSDEQAGRVFKGLFQYVSNGKLPSYDPVTNVVLKIFKSSIDEAKRRYEEKCRQNKDNAEKRWKKEKCLDTNECERIQSDANECDDMPNDNEYDNDDEYEENSSIPNGLECKMSDDIMPESRQYPRLFLDKKDFVRVQQMWNDTCKDFRKVTKLTSKPGNKRNKRKGKIYACLNMFYEEYGTKERAFEKLQIAFDKIAGSKFLAGENERGWRAGFDWVMQTPHLIKILEGNYDNPETLIM